MNAFSNEICLNFKHQLLIFQHIVLIFWTLTVNNRTLFHTGCLQRYSIGMFRIFLVFKISRIKPFCNVFRTLEVIADGLCNVIVGLCIDLLRQCALYVSLCSCCVVFRCIVESRWPPVTAGVGAEFAHTGCGTGSGGGRWVGGAPRLINVSAIANSSVSSYTSESSICKACVADSCDGSGGMADSARAGTPSPCGGVESAEDAMYPERSSILD